MEKAKEPFVVLNLKLPPAMKAALAKKAKREDATASQIVRRLIADWLKK
jgi:Ribbon-helix-helix protein, copG family